MKVLCLLAWLVLMSACSSFGVRCDTRLRPINPPQAARNGLPATAPTTPVPAATSPVGKPPAEAAPTPGTSAETSQTSKLRASIPPSPKLPGLTSPTSSVPALPSGSGSPEKP